jgi:hypothetical protein
VPTKTKKRPISAKTRDEAIRALDGMAQIIRNEMLTHGSYVSSEVVNEELAKQGAICGGHEACAIGSLWIGGGVKINASRYGGAILPGVEEEERQQFLRNRDGLRVAYHELNAAAERYMVKNADRLRRRSIVINFNAPVEALFEEYTIKPKEGGRRRAVGRDELLKVVKSAKKAIRSRELRA